MANFPTRKISQPLNQFAFPNDLLANPERPSVSIQFISYRSAFYSMTTIGSSLTGIAQGTASALGVGSNLIQFISPTAGISLPLPKKINENQELAWNETSLMDLIGVKVPAVGSALTGIQINPFQLMYFQRPLFKQYAFTWTLAPNTPQESRTLLKIVNEFKRRSLPTAVGPLFDYPDIALVRFFPNNLNNHIIIKPCAVTSVQIDHAGTTTPSFFKNSGGAPVLVNITLQLKEIDIWTQNDYTGTTALSNLGNFGSAISTAVSGLGSLTEGT